ncbi:MAG: histidine phosphatase family protein [Candidatus Atribacteria bacterium]|nr:histidine phosphatase family protein [Candidatus Atribacteria bacterium]
MAIKLILIRHGESDGNLKREFSGFKDVELAKKGIWQAERLAYRLKRVPVDAVYCSDLKRARRTAEIIFQGKGIDIITNPNFREINFGEWEGYTFEEVKSRHGYGDEFGLWLENTDVKIAIPQGESLADLNNRVMNELSKILKKHQKEDKDKTIAIVCHGGTIRVILCNAFNLELKYIWNIKQNSTALNIIEYYNHKGVISLLNDTSHLEDWWESGLIKEKRDE